MFGLPGACWITVRFAIFGPFLIPIIGEIRAVCYTTLCISADLWTPWKSWTGMDVASGSVDDVSFVNFWHAEHSGCRCNVLATC